MSGGPPSILLWGTYDTSKPRARILARGIRESGALLREIHAPVWESIVDKSQVHGLLAKVRVLGRWLLAYPGLAWRLLVAPKPDLILIGYPGVLDAFVAAPIARMRGIPLVWDLFISMYDTVCNDRGLLPAKSLTGRLLWLLERCAIRCVDLVFMDTEAHARRVETLFEMDAGSCDRVWVGVERELFPVASALPRDGDRRMRVLFYGQFIPLHGIEAIIGAARKLRAAPIQWMLIGRGQSAGKIRAMLDEDPLANVSWDEWVDYPALAERLHHADLCLGIFGTSEKAASVIPNKVFQILAAGRPLVTLDSPAIRELLCSIPPCVYLVPAGDVDSLAQAVLAHHRQFITGAPAIACHADTLAHIDAAAIGLQFHDMLRRRKLSP